MKLKKLISGILAGSIIFSGISAFAMSTWEFDNGMKKGINYFNRGLYYEARDEFQWFCDYNWGSMNSGQQQYALDYLGAANQRAEQASNVSYSYDYDDDAYYNYDNVWDGYLWTLRVVNCNEWVSLREQPSVNSRRLAKVPLWAYINSTGLQYKNFTDAYYNGQWGWILTDYLEYDC